MLYDIENPRSLTVTRDIKWANDVINLYWDSMFPVDAVQLATAIGINVYESAAENFTLEDGSKTSIILLSNEDNKRSIMINDYIKEDLGEEDAEIVTNALVAIVLGAYFCNPTENRNWALDYEMVNKLLDNTCEITLELMFAADLLIPDQALHKLIEMFDEDKSTDEQATELHVPVAILSALATKMISEQDTQEESEKD